MACLQCFLKSAAWRLASGEQHESRYRQGGRCHQNKGQAPAGGGAHDAGDALWEQCVVMASY